MNTYLHGFMSNLLKKTLDGIYPWYALKLPKVVRYEITSSREVCFTAKSCIPKGPLLARIWPKITLGGSFGTLN